MTTPYPYPPPAVPSAAPRKTAWYRRAWVLAATAGIVGIIIGSSATGSSSSTKTKTVTNTVAGPTVSVTAPAVTHTARPTVIKTIATKTQQIRVTYTPPLKNKISDGVYEVGRDIPAGTYRTPGGSDCYYAILNTTSSSDIADNNNSTGPMIATLNPGKYFELSGGCTWSRA
jgi:hypothetical protein